MRSQLNSLRPPASVVLGIVLMFLAGIASLIVVSYLKFEWHEVAWDLLRDLGAALIVAAAVAVLFELYRSVWHQIKAMRDVIDITMGERITPEVWLELRDLIDQRKVIRRNAVVRWDLFRDKSLGANQAIMRIEHSYELHSLTSKARKFLIEHELDYHMRDAALDLPRFTQILIDRPEADAAAVECREKLVNGKFTFEIELNPSGGRPVHVRVERLELVPIPGSYNLYTPEFTKGLDVYYGDCVDGIDPEVWVRPLGRGLNLKHVGNNWSCEHLLLPGQGIEIKFPLAIRENR